VRLPEALRPYGAWADVVVVLAAATAFGTCVSSIGCARGPCAPERLAELEAAYVAEMVAACQGYTRATCPSAGRIEAKYAEQRSGWVRCSK